MIDPTRTTSSGLTEAYDFFNERLFGGRLPRCLITMQRQKGAYGYFAGRRFGSRDGAEVTDEIALNPAHFKSRTTEESLSTLVHEMAHLEQHHFGKPRRTSYHNKQWAGMMQASGLIRAIRRRPGGKETGQRVGHYIATAEPSTSACRRAVGQGFAVRYVELWGDPEKRKKKAASKTRNTPVRDCGLNAWGKPDIDLVCGECEESHGSRRQRPGGVSKITPCYRVIREGGADEL